MGKFIKIENRAITESLSNVRRQYLVGNLQMPQALDFIRSENLEIGISSYKCYTEEPAHKHSIATEYQFVLSGWTKYLDTDTMAEVEFKKGDFFAIESGTSYAQKCKAGTEILFIKVPSINDKEIVEETDDIKRWFDQKLKTVRRDYSHQDNMPVANSVRPAAAVAIIDNGKILMLRRKDNGKWTLPGGTLEFNESLTDCATREVKEECGLKIFVSDIIGTYTDPDIRIEYSDGEVRREFTIVYFATTENAEVIIDDESTSYRWIELNSATDLPMTESQKIRISDVVTYLSTNRKVLK